MKTWVYGEYLVYAKNKNVSVEKFKEKFGLVVPLHSIKRGPSL